MGSALLFLEADGDRQNRAREKSFQARQGERQYCSFRSRGSQSLVMGIDTARVLDTEKNLSSLDTTVAFVLSASGREKIKGATRRPTLPVSFIKFSFLSPELQKRSYSGYSPEIYSEREGKLTFVLISEKKNYRASANV